MASGSRGSFIALIVCSIIFLFYQTDSARLQSRIAIVFALLGLLGFSIIRIMGNNTDYAIFERLYDTYENDADAGRAELNRMAIEIFADNPLWGAGAEGFRYEMLNRFGETRTVHNLYLHILAMTGLLGFSSFMTFLFRILLQSYRHRIRDALALTLIIFVMLLAYKTGSMLTYIPMWYIFAICISFCSNNNHLIYQKSSLHTRKRP